MKITGIKTSSGKKLTEKQMNSLVMKLQKALEKRGFISQVVQKNGSAITISNGGTSFVVDVKKLGYNARINSFTVQNTKKGYKRTNTPTWTQREQFNHTVNGVLDQMKLSARIVSGEYDVRYLSGSVDAWDMPEPYYSHGLQVPSVLEVVPLDLADQAVEWYGIQAPFIAVDTRFE